MLGLGRCMPPMPQRIMGNKYSMYFDGVNDYGEIENNNLMTPVSNTDGFTVSYWFKQRSGTSGTHFQIANTGEENVAYFRIESDTNRKIKVSFNNEAGDTTTITGATTLDLNKWYFIVVMLGGEGSATMKLYINGAVDPVSGTPGLESDWADAGLFYGLFGTHIEKSDDGWQDTKLNSLNCYIDQFSWTNKQFTEQLIKQIYYAHSEFDFLTVTNYYTSTFKDELKTWYTPTVGWDGFNFVKSMVNPSITRAGVTFVNGATTASETPRD